MRRSRPRCGACGHRELRDGTETLSVTLPQSGVVASIAAPARRCAGCGEVHVESGVLARVRLAVGCELADLGVHTGDAFRHMRKALGFRAADLAELLGVTPETISHWETGKAAPTRAAFAAIAAMVDEALGGRTATRDRLAVLAEGRPFPRAVTAKLRRPQR